MFLCNRISLFAAVILLLGMESAYASETRTPTDEFNLKKEAVLLDQLGRTVYTRAKGPISYAYSECKENTEHRIPSGVCEGVLRDDKIFSHPTSFQVHNHLFQETWRYAVFGNGIGKSGIIF